MIGRHKFQILINRHRGTPGVVVLPDSGFRRAKEEIASWPFGESSLNREHDHILDTTKLRAAGFPGYEDSYAMFARHLRMLQEWRIIPRAGGAV